MHFSGERAAAVCIAIEAGIGRLNVRISTLMVDD
jgi:hypothetical protein